MGAVPERVRWAVETLAVEPADRVLEIGCGPGVAAALICARLVERRLLAVDRSPTQIERARRRNDAHLAAGRLSLETAELAELDVGCARFDRVFAVNLNVFWLGPAAAELAAVRRALAPDGKVFLFYGAPVASRAREIVERVSGVLRRETFAEPEILAPTPTLVACVAGP